MRWLVITTSVLALAGSAVAVEPVARADDDMGARIAAANSYLATRPGVVGYVLRDRKTRAVYRNAHATDPVWTASTIKLAMVVDLLTRQRAGSITLTDADNRLIAAMLHSSDDDAADALWSRYGCADHRAYNSDFPAYGMTSLQPQRGYSNTFPYWGFQKATPDDLDRLINYTLTRLNPADTASIVGQLHTSIPISSGASGARARRWRRATRTAGHWRTTDGSSTPSASPATGSATRSR